MVEVHPRHRFTVYEPLDVLGAALDAAGDPQTGYTGRGEREPWMECLWEHDHSAGHYGLTRSCCDSWVNWSVLA